MKYLKPVFICLILLSASGQSLFGQSKVGTAGMRFLNIYNSARANGMGGCWANITDEQSAMMNPGAAGIFYLNKQIAVSLPNSIKFYPDIIDDFRLKSFLAGLRVPAEIHCSNNKFIGALTYFQQTLNTSVILRTDYGYPIGDTSQEFSYFRASDVVRGITASIGFGSRCFKLGIGISGKYVKEKLDMEIADGHAYDLGLLAEISLSQLAARESSVNDAAKIQDDLTFSFAFVHANEGQDMGFGSEKNPLPTSTTLGFSLIYSLARHQHQLLSLRPAFQMRHLESLWTRRLGLETGLSGVIFLRAGKIEDIDDLSWGFGLSIMEALRRLNILHRNPNPDSSFLNDIKNELDISFDFARSDDYKSSNTNYWQINLSF
ncbi:MAG: hypothetical protein CVT49_11120 [candidate division Zixibacteria bacterium HGW-Zixibacteria-1]|nr:MAG: hypothetical protein CVT49_11120 [candidate division Zixibacteria bacterium HGW-Zixibacteria-1]